MGWMFFFFKCGGVSTKGLVREILIFPCEKMKGFSQNAYVYTLEECVGLENFFFLTSIEG
jgi:hypothetical protein